MQLPKKMLNELIERIHDPDLRLNHLSEDLQVDRQAADPTIGPLAAAIIDVLFLALASAATGREVLVGRNWRNVPPILIVLIFLAGNIIFHLEDYKTGTAEFATRLGIAAAIAFISFIGGRVIPSFTHNWLVRENPGRLPTPFGRLDIAILSVSLLALLLWISAPLWNGTAILMLIAGAAQVARLAQWAGDRTLRDRLLLILHVGYAFVPIGFWVLAGATLFPETVPATAGIHTWTVGAIGTMTLAIMTRASLGHTGHKLAAGPLTQVIYAAVVISALLRIAAAFPTGATVMLLDGAGAAWIAAFWMFAVGYGPSLWRPRLQPVFTTPSQ